MQIVCVASGPSLTQADVDYCRGKATVFVVNDCYKLAPWADVLYACDYEWIVHHAGVPDFQGEKWTINRSASREYGWNCIDYRTDALVSSDPAWIASGKNSGFQVFNLALLRQPSRIILLGYDMKLSASGARHWFGNHPGNMNRRSDYQKWIAHFEKAVPLVGCEVLNCTLETNLNCFPHYDLRKVL